MAAVTLSVTSCKKYLDVRSKSEVVENDMFSNEEGFTDAMAGVYYTMSGSSLYGDKLTMSFMDVIAHRYDILSENNVIGNSNYAFTNSNGPNYYGTAAYYTTSTISNIISNIWDSMYYSIANVNNILLNIDAHKSVFQGNDYNLIKGEALGLRGFLHFDLLRMFGQPYLTGADSANIPYVTIFTAGRITPLYTTEAVTDSAIADLNAAAILLKGDNLQSTSDVNDWLNDRKFHFNALAVEATLARIYLYKGDQTNALLHANNVINSGELQFVSQANLSGNVSGSGAPIDYSCTPEQIFSLNVINFTLTTSAPYQYFYAAYIYNPLANDCASYPGDIENLENIYETATGGATDFRYLYLWSKIPYSPTGIGQPQKLSQQNAVTPNDMPIIRLPEMYYIAAECGGPVAGLAALNKVRENRGLKDLPSGLDQATFQNEIFKEYQKEFYCEGQLFYYYKRLNLPNMVDCDNITLFPTTGGVYVFPLPANEIQYGGR